MSRRGWLTHPPPFLASPSANTPRCFLAVVVGGGGGKGKKEGVEEEEEEEGEVYPRVVKC